MSSNHPSLDALSELRRASVNGASDADVAAHVASCAACQETLASLETLAMATSQLDGLVASDALRARVLATVATGNAAHHPGAALGRFSQLELRARVRAADAANVPVVTLGKLPKAKDGTFTTALTIPWRIVFEPTSGVDQLLVNADAVRLAGVVK